jgi:excisionase family DNA binding protein
MEAAQHAPASLELFTIKQVQNLLKISRSTVNRMANDGRLKKVSLGFGSARITRQSVHSLLAVQ